MQRRRPRPPRSDRHTRRLLRALLALYQLLRTPRPIDSLLQSILDTAIACVPGAQRGSLMLREGQSLVYHAAYGYNLAALQQVRFPASEIHELLGGSRVVQVYDYLTWDEHLLSPEMNRVLKEHGKVDQIRRSLVSTIHVGGKFYGSVVLDNLRSHAPFPPEAETLARLLAEQAGMLLDQALLVEQLRQTSAQLIEAERLGSLGRFIASIAHEINNPLTAVMGYADFLTQAKLDADSAAMLAQLRRGAERVRLIVRNLQLFARQQKSGVSQVNLNLLVEQTITLMRSELAHDLIEITLRLDPDLPYTWGDGGQLSQVLLNLLINAQHALLLRSPPRELSVETALATGEGGHRLLLVVADNGPGVAPELRGRIFEPFFTTKSAGQGTGLGLSICQNIVVAHGGLLSVAPVPAGGASFSVDLPLRAMPDVAPLPPPEPLSSAPRPSGLRVLLIDDDPAVVDVVLRSLELANSVEAATSGAEGLRLALEGAYDLLICDLRMPDLDGLELFVRLVAARPELAARVLFISGDTNSAATRGRLAATGRPLLTKPFRPEELYAAIAALG